VSTDFSEALFSLRRRRNKLQKQVALAASIDPSYLAALENGRRSAPRKHLVDRLCDALDATLDERAQLESAAVYARLLESIAEYQDDIKGGDALAAFAAALPQLSAAEIEAISNLVEVLRRSSRSRHGETAM
jgi:transcriptional regulator with XRE-family HTH domain